MNADSHYKRKIPHKRVFFVISVCIFFIIFSSCNSSKTEIVIKTDTIPLFNDGTPVVSSNTAYKKRNTLILTFAGDIMAHRPNYSMKNYSAIYKSIKPILQSGSLAFANLETPVCDNIPLSTYPQFNVHHDYVDAAINAGFNVFSLANNHSNDQFLEGILSTQKYFENIRENKSSTYRPVYFSGLKNKDNPLSYDLIKTKGWTILFVAVTEILNRPQVSNYINYITKEQKESGVLRDALIELRRNNPCDLFILSVHCDEPEYVRTISQKQKDYYYSLLDSGIDIIWANHPHVARNWELVSKKDLNINQKMIFYSLGNTISAQRWDPSFNAAETERDYTGDGYLVQIYIDRIEDDYKIVQINPVLITTYITPSYDYVIECLTDEFITSLQKNKNDKWASYLNKRKQLMESTKGINTWR